MRGTNLSYIPGELASAAQGVPIASADGIKDYILNKYQEEINSEVHASIQDLILNLSNFAQSILNITNNVSRISQDTSTNTQDIQVIKDNITQIMNSLTSIIEQGNNYSGPKHIILTQEQYDSLQSIDNNAIYFIIDGNNITWQFGNTFPIILQGDSSSSIWTFGKTFPIKLTNSKWEFGDTLPIILDKIWGLGNPLPIILE